MVGPQPSLSYLGGAAGRTQGQCGTRTIAWLEMDACLRMEGVREVAQDKPVFYIIQCVESIYNASRRSTSVDLEQETKGQG